MKCIAFSFLLLAFSYAGIRANPTEHGPETPAHDEEHALETPMLKFMENVGQWEKPVRYRADLPGGRLWLRETGFTYAFQDMAQLNQLHEHYYHGDPAPGTRVDDELVRAHAILVDFIGANPHPSYSLENKTPGYYNFFLGNDQTKWKSGLNAYERVEGKDIYAGIDIEVYSQFNRLKYDFIVSAGADPAQIQLSYSGQDGLYLEEGNLNIETSVGKWMELKPYVYQVVNGEKVEVESEYVLQGNVLGFAFPNGYDTSLPLVIDPTLVAATYSGSTATCYGHTATYDQNENIYSGGICFGVGFPTTGGAFQQTFGGSIDQAINKYNPDATALIWSTYIGGSTSDYPHSLVVNDMEELIVLGSTNSSDFPVSSSAFQGTYQGGNSDIVLTHLNMAATGIVGSTFIGGSDQDGQNPFSLAPNYGDTYRGEVIVDDAGDIYVGSVTSSNNFPTTNGAFQTNLGGGSDGTVLKMSPDLSTMLWGTLVGGTGDDNTNGLKFTSTYEVYFTGGAGTGLPTTAGSFQAAFAGGQRDAYVGHLSSNGQNMISLSYAGTSSDDLGYFLEIDLTGDPYILGEADNYPVSGNVYSQADGEIFIQKFDVGLTTGIWSTTIGGSQNSLSPTAFLVDNCGNIYSSSFGTTTGLDVTPNAYDPTGGSEFYLIVLEPNASGLLYATHFGTNYGEHVDGGTCRFDKRGTVYESVCTNTSTWPTTPNAVFPTDPNSGYDVTCFKFEFNFADVTAAFAPNQPANGCAPYPVTFNNSSTANTTTNYFWDFGDGNTSTAQSPNHTYLNPGNYTVTLIVSDSGACNGADTATSQIIIGAQPPISVSLDTTTCFGSGVELETIFVPGATYDWSPGATLSDSTTSNPIANPNVTTVYTLIVTDQYGCADTADVTVNIFVMESEAGPTNSFCEGEGGTQLVAGSITGGTAPYYYTWWCDSTNTFCGLDSTFDNDPIANPDTTTWYYLQVVDGNGCIGTIDSVLVEVIPKPILDAGPDVSICANPSPGALLTASVLNSNEAPGPYDITWFPTAGLNDPTIFTPYARPDTTTIYTAIVTSSNGCNSQATTVDTLSSITVTVHPQPIAEAGQEVHLCYGDSIQLQGLGFGAGPDYDFEWSPVTGISDSSSSSPMVSPELTTDYTLTVWSNGCPSIGDPVRVWVHTIPTPSAGNIQDICLGGTAQLDAFADGDSSALYTYDWYPAATLNDPTLENPTANPDSTTWYYLVTTSSWGCESALDSVQVTVIPTPLAEAGPDVEMCSGDSLQLQGGFLEGPTGPPNMNDIFYTWTPDQQISSTTDPQPWVYPTASGWYHLTVDHSVCSTHDSVLITVIPQISPVVYADTGVGCEGDSIQLHALGGLGNATFTWSPADGLSDPTDPEPWAAPGQTTTYTLVAAEAGCDASKEVTLEIIPRPDVSYLSSLNEGCAPFTVSFLDNSADVLNYVWDFGDGATIENEPDPIHIYDEPGSYTVTLTGINTGGCAAEASTVTVNVAAPLDAEFALQALNQPQMNSAPMEIYMPSSGVVFTDQTVATPLTWTWDFGDGNTSDEQNPTHHYQEEGQYMVTLTVQNEMGCPAKAVHGPIVVVAPDLFIPNVFSPNDDDVNDRFMVEYNGSQPFHIKIFDRWGVVLYDSKNRQAPWNGNDANGQQAPEGTYYYHLTIGEKEFAGDLTLVR